MPKSERETKNSEWSHDFARVLNGELDRIKGKDEEAGKNAICRAHKGQLVGLAFSGGGIRSATFNLGVLQALAQMKLLSRFNYLSTVSGGSYIGSWLMAWMKRRGVKDVRQALSPEWVKQPGHREPREIHFLRQFSNYLTPQLGWLGADMWTVIAIYIRNLTLNLVILGSALALVLLVPRWLAHGSVVLWSNAPFLVWVGFAFLALIVAALSIARNTRYFGKTTTRPEPKIAPGDYLENNCTTDASGITWSEDSWDDFILRLQFRIEAAGQGCIYFWKGVSRGCPNADAAEQIRISNPALSSLHEDIEPTGTLNGCLPVHPPEFRPKWSDLEATFVKHRCTVRINGEAINAGQIKQWAPRVEPSSNRVPDAIGWRGDGVKFQKIRVEKIESPFGKCGSQPYVQKWIILPLFVAAFITTFLFQFGDWRDAPPPGPTVPALLPLPALLAAPGLAPLLAVVPVLAPLEAPAAPKVLRDWLQNAEGSSNWIWGLGALLVLIALANKLPLMQAGLKWLRKQKWSLPIAIALAVAILDAFGIWMMLGLFPSPAASAWPWWRCALVAGGISALFLSLTRAAGLAWHAKEMTSTERSSELRQIGSETISMGISAALGGVLVWMLNRAFRGATLWEVTAWGTPAIIGVFLATMIMYVGLLGRSLPDERREWWSRLSAWLLIYALAWIGIFGVAFYAPVVLHHTNQWAKGAISLGWLVSTVAGLIAARSAITSERKSNKAVELIATVAPYVFVLGFFMFLSAMLNLVLSESSGRQQGWTPDRLFFTTYHWVQLDAGSWIPLLLVTLVLLATVVVLSVRLDINQFSMHMLYRNRLGRCYLGASNPLRHAQPFTGFSAEDDFKLAELSCLRFGPTAESAPYPIFNAALNLVGGKELAWQQRKAASFVFTPLYCGYDFPELPPGYCPTNRFARTPSPISLATAMAISGAAASPNMGYHTSPAPAFLMTVFNVRLGWWLGNPRAESTWTSSAPLNVLFSLMQELFGLTSDEGKYIYLSDGGHFENLGIYELVRRRCRFIVACDAEEDSSFGFDGLGNAIEKCRSDFGIDLAIDVEPIRGRSEKGHSEWHCAIGKIRYSQVDPDARDGILVYLKSSLTGDEPTDVLRYAAANSGFPHQSTGDQWFDESQFESYRALGRHVVESVFGALDDLEKLSIRKNEELFVDLAQRWYPPSAATKESFTKHAPAVAAIYDRLRKDTNLAFLSEQIYPEWRTLFKTTEEPATLKPPQLSKSKAPKSLSERLPKTPGDLQAGFYICNSVFRIMEDVYVDLDLEKEFDHPDNRGWMNLFKHWAWAPMVRVTWTISASNFGARFQTFCARHLNLTIGTVRVEPEREIESRADLDWANIRRLNRTIARSIRQWLVSKPLAPDVVARACDEVKPVLEGLKGTPLKPLDAGATGLKTVVKIINRGLKQLEKVESIPTAKDRPKDEEWFTVATLWELVKQGVPPEHPEIWKIGKNIADIVLERSTAILQRCARPAIQALNGTERELTELFLVYNPKLIPDFRIFRFELAPGYPITGAGSEIKEGKKETLQFPFGFAIVAEFSSNKPTLVYFRIRDHLRRIGLARAALGQLIETVNRNRNAIQQAEGDEDGENRSRERTLRALQLGMEEMHPGAHEVPTGDDRERFERLYDSVVAALDQKRPEVGSSPPI